MRSLFSLLFLFLLSGCVAFLAEDTLSGKAYIQTEVYKETPECTGKGVLIKSVKKEGGRVKKVEGTELYLEKGNYFIYYSYKEQVLLHGVQGEGISPCATKTIIFSSLRNIEKIKIEEFPNIKLKIEQNKEYYLYIKDRELYVESS